MCSLAICMLACLKLSLDRIDEASSSKCTCHLVTEHAVLDVAVTSRPTAKLCRVQTSGHQKMHDSVGKAKSAADDASWTISLMKPRARLRGTQACAWPASTQRLMLCRIIQGSCRDPGISRPSSVSGDL